MTSSHETLVTVARFIYGGWWNNLFPLLLADSGINQKAGAIKVRQKAVVDGKKVILSSISNGVGWWSGWIDQLIIAKVFFFFYSSTFPVKDL